MKKATVTVVWVVGLALAVGPVMAGTVVPASYSYSTPPNAHGSYYQDDSGSDLTDGVLVPVGSGIAIPDPSVGWARTTAVDITFDLGGTVDLHSTTIGHAGIPNNAKWAPDDVTLSFSTDGVTYGSPVTSDGFTVFSSGGTYGRDDLVLATPVTASHVKVSLDGGTKHSGTNTNGYLLDEISFATSPAHSVAPYPDNDANTMLLYHLDEPTGSHSMSPGTTFIADSSGSGQDLRTNYDTSNPGSTTSNPGLSPFDGAASVNGLGTAMTRAGSQRAYRVDNANTSVVNEDAFTIEAWIRPDTVSSHRAILRVDDDRGGGGLIQFGLLDGKLRIAGFNAAGGFQDILSSVYPFLTGQWYHVAVTYDDAANEAKFFVDPETSTGLGATRAGTQLGSTIATGIDWHAFDAAGDIWVGEYESGSYLFAGDIDEVRWSNVVRDSFNLSAVAAPVPEPATVLAVFAAVAGLGGYIRKRRRA